MSKRNEKSPSVPKKPKPRLRKSASSEISPKDAATVQEVTQNNIKAIAEIEESSEANRTIGELLADRFALLVGSWTFVIVQSLLLAIWVILNVIAWSYHWDPYPFILLNLGLSFQAAYASPIIMMSQNRQSQLADRRNRLDLQINMLAEQENTEMLRLLRLLCEANGIDISKVSSEALEQETSARDVLDQIDNATQSKD